MRIFSQTLKKAGLLTASLVLLVQSILPLSALAASVTPVYQSDNPTCADLGYANGFKPTVPSQSNPTGAHNLPGNAGTVTVTVDGFAVDWTSTIGIDAVIVKAGSGANIYTYSPESLADTDLQTPNNGGQGQQTGLSHLVFCYDIEESETGNLQVKKKTDYGNGFVDDNPSDDFVWGLDNETPTRAMGSTANDIAVGNHTVTENSVVGYEFTGWYEGYGDCRWPESKTYPISVNVEKDELTKITLCNKAKTGSITIIKDAQPNNEWWQSFKFSFRKQGSVLPNLFSLNDDGNNADFLWNPSNTKTFDNLTAGTYIIKEIELIDGWTLADIVCSEGATVTPVENGVSINLTNGAAVTCTFVNQQNGIIKVRKHTDPAGDQTKFDIEANPVNGDGQVFFDNTRKIADGEWEIFYVTQGTYNITETLPEGWIQSSTTCDNVTVSANDLIKICDIYNSKFAKLTVQKETNPNGSEQVFNFDLDGEPFTLTDGESEPFENLLPGTYTITEEALAGWELDDISCSKPWTFISPTSASVTLAAGDDVTCTYTNNQLNQITGSKFNDLNGNGHWDKGEPTIEGWTIRLYQCGDGCSIEPVDTTTTDENGNYSFGELSRGYYLVCEVMQEGWVQTYPNYEDDCYFVAIEEFGIVEDGNDFGNFKLGNVDGFKFNDGNGNGKYDAGEEKLSGWTIKLYQTTCEVEELPSILLKKEIVDDEDCTKVEEEIDSTATDANGNYSFGELEAGDYRVCEVMKSGWHQTAPASADGCYSFSVTSGFDGTFNFGNKANDPGQVLGVSTPTLVNTGASAAMGIIAALSIIGTASGVVVMSRRKQEGTTL